MHLHDRHTPSGVEEVLEEAHSAIALLLGTVVASPVLIAALSGRQSVATAATLYLVAIVGAWIVVGLLAGALSAAGHRTGRITTDATDAGADPGTASAPTAADSERDPDPAPATR